MRQDSELGKAELGKAEIDCTIDPTNGIKPIRYNGANNWNIDFECFGKCSRIVSAGTTLRMSIIWQLCLHHRQRLWRIWIDSCDRHFPFSIFHLSCAPTPPAAHAGHCTIYNSNLQFISKESLLFIQHLSILLCEFAVAAVYLAHFSNRLTMQNNNIFIVLVIHIDSLRRTSNATKV